MFKVSRRNNVLQYQNQKVVKQSQLITCDFVNKSQIWYLSYFVISRAKNSDFSASEVLLQKFKCCNTGSCVYWLLWNDKYNIKTNCFSEFANFSQRLVPKRVLHITCTSWWSLEKDSLNTSLPKSCGWELWIDFGDSGKVHFPSQIWDWITTFTLRTFTFVSYQQ